MLRRPAAPGARQRRACGSWPEVGPEVHSVQPGDRVSMSFIAACGACRWCVSGATYLCD
ncbi:alcohol dehydrogenase catalytic domain-containing protein, partial [Mycobacterium kyorinense]|uniref:alcohol dehydrogenase catalytic domain-containing protein n=1 Tax=Mycobacterium kyorinense TaxID=487514 RepID=UPI003F703BEA